MLGSGGDDDVPLAEAQARVAAGGGGGDEGVGDEVECFGGVLRPHQLLGAGTGEARDDLPPAFVELCGFFRESVGAAVHSVMIVALEVLVVVVFATPVVPRRRRTEVGEVAAAMHGAREHGKVGADRGVLA